MKWSLAAALLVLIPAASTAAGSPAPGCDVIVVLQRTDVLSYPLPRTFLRAGGDSAWTATRSLVPGQDYVLDRTHGRLRLRVPPVAGETLWVHVCGLVNPPALEYRFMSYRPARSTADSTVVDSLSLAPVPRPATQHIPSEAPPGATLSLAGNKTVAVEFGSSQDALLRQSLDLAVTGTLAPGVELTGALSDRDTPLSPVGSTRDLQALDQLLFELRTPHGGVALGDVALSLGQGEFARVDRQLQGARGDWSAGMLQGVAAAASADGEFRSLQFYGIEGQQGPYNLTGAGGATGIAVVPGSEQVTLDGERMVRGEGADYAIDYDRGQVTFSNRRPVSSASRITVDYQIALNRYRRNFAAAAARGGNGPWTASFAVMSETDDRGRPIVTPLDASDQLVLAAVGDSSFDALGSGVTPGVGDYDLVEGPLGPYYAFAGTDSGAFILAFARVGPGRGDYADSVIVAGRTLYRYVGPNAGAFRIGRPLPLAETHQLWSAGAGARVGALSIDFEGAFSRRDHNAFSTRDDQDNLGGAGNARMALETEMRGWLAGRAGVSAQWRSIGTRFAPFTRLDPGFAQEDWGLPVSVSLEQGRRAEMVGFLRTRWGGEVRATAGQLATAGGFDARRGSVSWERLGTVVTRARWERAEGEQSGVAYPDGGRDRRTGTLGLRLGLLEPMVHAEWDERWTPSDTGRAGDRAREVGAELRGGTRFPLSVVMGAGVRRNAVLGATGWRERDEIQTQRVSLVTPAERSWSTTMSWQHRVQRAVESPAQRASDLVSTRVRGVDVARGVTASAGLEVTSEGENERFRSVVFVGSGQGPYDSLGTLVGAGRGDYNLVITLGPGLQRVARAASSLRLSWQPPASGGWQGSRVEASVETEARRRGDLVGADLLLSGAAALNDPALSRGAVTHRLESEVAPASTVGALTARIERRVNTDRSFTLFAQTQDDRSASLRWRTRPVPGWTTEVEGRVRRTQFSQNSGSAAGYGRSAREGAMQGQLGFSPGSRLRAALVSDVAWTRDEADAPSAPWSKTWRAGPELGLSVFGPGRIELSARRTLLAGTPLTTLLPLGDPFGTPRWEATARFDYRLRDQTTMGVSMVSREYHQRAPQHEGRAEVRAFF